MKTVKASMKWLAGAVLVIVLVSSCKKDNPGNVKTSVVFGFQSTHATTLKSTKATGEPVASAIIVSVEKPNGEVVYNREKLELSYLNGSYLSQGLSLLQGNYNLTEFLVTDTGNRIIYASPKAGSDLARLVSKPLPINFNVQAGIENILIPEVISADSSSLKDFGYVGFSFNPVKTLNLLITVLSKDANSNNFGSVDSSNLSVYTNGHFLSTLKKGVNIVNFPYGTIYILYIWKKGYTSWMKIFSPDEIVRFTTTPLQVILSPIDVPSITFYSHNNGIGYYGPGITSRSVHTFYGDYSDGQSDTITGTSAGFGKGQDFPDNRLLQIWGSVGDIQSLTIENPKNEQTVYDSIDLHNATSLESLTFYLAVINKLIVNTDSLKSFTSYLSQVPFSFDECPNLESITILGSYLVDIHTNYKLKHLEIDGHTPVKFGDNPNFTSLVINDNNLSPGIQIETIESMLPPLLKSVIKYPRSGSFTIYSNYVVTGYNFSDEALQIMDTLKTTYNWTFSY